MQQGKVSKMETSVSHVDPEQPLVGGGSPKGFILQPGKLKIVLAMVMVTAVVVAMITLGVVIAKRDRDENNEGPIPVVIPCSFNVAFKNWAYWVNGCPAVGTTVACTSDASCTIGLNQSCVPGGNTQLLRCVSVAQQSVCGFAAHAPPSLSTSVGTCDSTSTYNTCALCNVSGCSQGQLAFCLPQYKCSNSIVCFPRGNAIGS